MATIHFYILFFAFTRFIFDIPFNGSYKILSHSRVYLTGTSNVNKFTCDCFNEFDMQTYSADLSSDELIEFGNTFLQLPVELIDCKNRKMDKDLQKAMKMQEHPNVLVELNKVKIDKANHSVQASVHLTLAGVRKKYELQVKAEQQGKRLHVKGNKTLLMTDFGIHPPQVLFGMIKVNDPITFYFDLQVELHHSNPLQ